MALFNRKFLLVSPLVVALASAQGDFYEWRFRDAVSRALKSVQSVLDTTRSSQLAEDEDHTYDDKYALAEFVTNTAIASYLNAVNKLGLTQEMIHNLSGQVQSDKGVVMARFEAEDSCAFLKEVEVEVVPGETVEYEVTTNTEESGMLGNVWKEKTQTVKNRVITKVKEYHWNVGMSYKLFLYQNGDVGTAIELQSRNASAIINTSGGTSVGAAAKPECPIPARTLHKPIDINLTWLFHMISQEEQTCQFAIDRFSEKAKKSCRTPRRNDDIDEALKFNRDLYDWAGKIIHFFKRRIEEEISGKHRPINPSPSDDANFSSLRQLFDNEHAGESIFVPIIPLMENNLILSSETVDKFLQHQNHTINEAINKMSKLFPSSNQQSKMLSLQEATISLACDHIQYLAEQYKDSINYIEYLLREQLIQAIGKEIGPKDFDEFMHFHNAKLFDEARAPAPFTYSVRRPNHFPDGAVSIESTTADGSKDPIKTFVRRIPGQDYNPSIFIPIDAATSVETTGDRYLHGWMMTRWQGRPSSNQYHITTRAHQFSSFIVVLGTMAGPDKFQPKDAIVLQNKDEVLIPLLTEVLPSAKEFKDAIASLSPEQKAFAQAFRGMQLESSVFGVCVIQIKPQLERLLGLPDGALTKEIQLTQDIMSLFVDYHIPSDLLAFDGEDDSSVTQKVEAVKKYTKAVTDVIDKAKEKQLEEEKKKAEMHKNMMRMASMEYEGPTAGPTAAPLSVPTDGPTAAPLSVPTDGPTAAPSGAPASGERSTRRRLKSFDMPQKVQSAQSAQDGEGGARTERAKTEAAAENVDEADTAGGPETADGPTSQSSPAAERGGEDFTLIPKLLDEKLEKYDTDGSLRSTIIKANDNVWTRTRKENMLTSSVKDNLYRESIDSEKKKAFDLLVALSRSGSLPIDHTELHIVIAVSHCFEQDIMTTIIEDNVNPIEKVEKSMLMIASTIYVGEPINGLVKGDDRTLKRLTESFPMIMNGDFSAANTTSLA